MGVSGGLHGRNSGVRNPWYNVGGGILRERTIEVGILNTMYDPVTNQRGPEDALFTNALKNKIVRNISLTDIAVESSLGQGQR